MLVDDIISLAEHPLGKQIYDNRLDEIALLLRKIPRFSFDGASMMAAHQVSRSKPSSVLSAMKFFRLPFDAAWIEWAGDIPNVELRTDTQGENITRATPRRMGVLARNTEITPGSVDLYFFWSHHHDIEKVNIPPVNPSLFACSLNRTEQSPEVPQNCFNEALRILGLRADPREITALAELIARSLIFIPYHMEAFRRRSIPDEKRDSFEAACKMDLAGEPPLTIAVICLLNTKNLIEVKNIDLDSLNNARKRRGRSPLLDYSEVSISLSKSAQRIAKATGMTGAELRKHLVRGHFKVRDSGIFWWRPFVRGNMGKPVLPQKYLVVA